MSENTVTVEYLWDEDLYLEAAKAAYDYELEHSPRRFMGWIFIALTQFGVVAALKQGVFGLLFISTLLVIYWYFLRWPMRRAMLRRRFAASGTAGKRFRFEIDDRGVVSPARTIPWDDILSVVRVSNGYLLYSGREFLYFPDNAFSGADARLRFDTWVKSKKREAAAA